jgi:hypothetical protein
VRKVQVRSDRRTWGNFLAPRVFDKLCRLWREATSN